MTKPVGIQHGFDVLHVDNDDDDGEEEAIQNEHDKINTIDTIDEPSKPRKARPNNKQRAGQRLPRLKDGESSAEEDDEVIRDAVVRGPTLEED